METSSPRGAKDLLRYATYFFTGLNLGGWSLVLHRGILAAGSPEHTQDHSHAVITLGLMPALAWLLFVAAPLLCLHAFQKPKTGFFLALAGLPVLALWLVFFGAETVVGTVPITK